MARSDDRDEKVSHLREHYALNPHPENVTDEMFLSDDFFDPRDMVQVKYEMLRRVSQEGQSVSRAAAIFGFSRTAFYQAQQALESGGLCGLIPRRRGPRRAHKLTDEVMEFVEEKLAEDKALSVFKLPALVEKQFGITVHPRSIQRGLARRRQKRGERRKK